MESAAAAVLQDKAAPAGSSIPQPSRILSGDNHRAAQTPIPPEPSHDILPPPGQIPVNDDRQGVTVSAVRPAQKTERPRRFAKLRQRFLPSAGPPRHTPLAHAANRVGQAATPPELHAPPLHVVGPDGQLMLDESKMVTPPQQVRGFGKSAAQSKGAGRLVKVGGEGFGRKNGVLHLPTILGALFKRLHGRSRSHR